MSEALLDALREAIEERGAPPHPDAVAPVLRGEVDPTARSWKNNGGEESSAMQRSMESALSYYTIEGLLFTLTPLGALSACFFMLQSLSGDHGEIPEGVDVGNLDVFGEIGPFGRVVVDEGSADESTCAKECQRALWHIARAYDAVMPETGNR